MPKFTIATLKTTFPNLTFKSGARFSFRPPKTITLAPDDTPNFDLLAFHEIGHHLCKKYDFTTEVERLKIERAAWEEAKKLCEKFDVAYDEDFVEEQLDSYRDWLHQKSLCPICHLNRFQDKTGHFHCPNCETFRTAKKTPKNLP